jgi:hypothetical protein
MGVGVIGATGATTAGVVVAVDATGAVGVVDVVGATVPVETSEVTGGVGVTVGVEDDGAGDVGVETTGDVGVLVVTTGVDDDGADTDELDDELEVLVDPPPPELTGTTGAELSIGVVVVVFTAGRCDLATTMFVGVVARVTFTLRIALTNERRFLLAFAVWMSCRASSTFCL